MANDQGARLGAFPYNAPECPPKVVYIKANTAQAIFRGQFVAQNNSGQVQVVPVGANQPAYGIAWDFLDTNLAGLPSSMTTLQNTIGSTNVGPFLPSGTDGFVGVVYDPMQLYVIEEQTGGTALTALSAGQCVNFTYIATTGNNFTGYVNSVIDNSSVTSGTGGLLQLITPNNILNQDGTVNAPGAACKWVVRISNHQLNGTKLAIPQG